MDINMKKNNKQQSGQPRKKIFKNDLALIIIFLAGAALFFAVYYLSFREDGAYVQIMADGSIYKTLSLNEDATITINGYNNGTNTLQVKDGYASIIHADCPDKLCQKQKKIRYKGETLVCLPNKVIVSVISEENSGMDSITY